ncbi:hypothetical protein RF55_3679 [Lasius niger]|uniref:Uncharacterized protein n=1 Tax=Lasius niger TaxID=67767 RepID=A0A0J7NUL4_LASNI|nr:hypothetical protein RF55_3679 [Lasius niger]
MLCTQHPSKAAITVTDIAARPADKKNREAFQHPGKTLESVAKPSTLKFAQCVLPNNLVQRLKIPTVGVYSSVPFSEIFHEQATNDRAGPTSHLGVMRPDKTAINAARDKSVQSRLRPVTIT